MNEREASSPELSVFLGLARQEPDWLHVTIDHGDVRLGAFLVGGEPARVRSCANHFAAEEVRLPGPVTHGFDVEPDDAPARPARRLEWVRKVRAARALEYLSRLGEEPTAGPEAIDWRDELALEGPPKASDTTAAAELLARLFAANPGPWALTRVARSASSGGLWAFGLATNGDLVLCSHDVEARRAGEPPSTLWLPRAGRAALDAFLDVDPTFGAEANPFDGDNDGASAPAPRSELPATLRKLSRTLAEAVQLVRAALDRAAPGRG
jgi:hypothetical protein